MILMMMSITTCFQSVVDSELEFVIVFVLAFVDKNIDVLERLEVDEYAAC